MTPSQLHPSLDGHAPAPKPICCGCQAAGPEAILVALHSSMFICSTCATAAAFEALAEGGRRICMALLEAEPTAGLRGVA